MDAEFPADFKYVFIFFLGQIIAELSENKVVGMSEIRKWSFSGIAS